MDDNCKTHGVPAVLAALFVGVVVAGLIECKRRNPVPPPIADCTVLHRLHDTEPDLLSFDERRNLRRCVLQEER